MADFYNTQHRPCKYDPALHSVRDVKWFMLDLFLDVASDLGVGDPHDDGFQDYAFDTLCDHGVSDTVIRAAWALLLRCNSPECVV